MTRFRPFRNGDPPALVELWNRTVPERNAVRPLGVHEFDALVIGRLGFEADGLIVAERLGRVVGFVHAGFGPLQECGPSHRLDRSLGAVAMLAVEPEVDDPDLERGLLLEAERYLRRRGARVVYAGGRHPLDPFYWGLYGSGEFSGILGDHAVFRRAVERAGYEPTSTAVLFEADLDRGDPRDPRIALLRRQTRLEVIEDALPANWWQALALGSFRPTSFVLARRTDGLIVARATTWEVAAGLGCGGPSRTALIDLEVLPEERRKGFGRLIVAEVLRHARNQMTDLVCVQTTETNLPALALYESTGFDRVEISTLYRLPADLASRSLASSAGEGS